MGRDLRLGEASAAYGPTGEARHALNQFDQCPWLSPSPLTFILSARGKTPLMPSLFF